MFVDIDTTTIEGYDKGESENRSTTSWTMSFHSVMAPRPFKVL
jgi:hypothetical protein